MSLELDPRPLFADVVEPILDDVLSQYSPPLAEKHFLRVKSHLDDAIAELSVVESEGRLRIDDDIGGPVICYEIRRGGTSPYGVIVTFCKDPEGRL